MSRRVAKLSWMGAMGLLVMRQCFAPTILRFKLIAVPNEFGDGGRGRNYLGTDRGRDRLSVQRHRSRRSEQQDRGSESAKQ